MQMPHMFLLLLQNLAEGKTKIERTSERNKEGNKD